MVTTLALMALLELAPNQATLKLTDIQASHGLMGPKREKDEVMLGDAYVLEWIIKGLKTDAGGKAYYTMSVEVKNSKGKVVFREKPKDDEKKEHLLSLGGDQVNAFYLVSFGTDSEPGKYTITITITDLTSKMSDSFTRTVEVLKPGFGMVLTSLSFDANGLVPAAVTIQVGQTIQINTRVTGYAVDEKKNPSFLASMRVLSGGKDVTKPHSVTINRHFDKTVKFMPLSFVLNMNRPGTFTIELKVADQIAKKVTTERFDITVVSRK